MLTCHPQRAALIKLRRKQRSVFFFFFTFSFFFRRDLHKVLCAFREACGRCMELKNHLHKLKMGGRCVFSFTENALMLYPYCLRLSGFPPGITTTEIVLKYTHLFNYLSVICRTDFFDAYNKRLILGLIEHPSENRYSFFARYYYKFLIGCDLSVK